ncbi:hypothetical protein [Sphingopyxis sp. R3-92]|uniref:hypothetical protein n=1 Tax=Sphingopyxis sp. R3-92 TaxID=3158553 RepID=UPI003EE4C7E1
MTLDDFLNGSWTIRDLRAGPFRDCIDLYTARLRKDGYSTVTARYSVGIVNCFIQWLIKHRFDRGDISDQLVTRFFEDENRGCGLRGVDPASIDRFVEVLREAGIVAPAVPRPPSPADQILERYSSSRVALSPCRAHRISACRFAHRCCRAGSGGRTICPELRPDWRKGT